MQVEKFTFFGSFYEAMNLLPEEQRSEFVMGILAYAFDGVEPSFEGPLSAMFALAKPNIDSSVKGVKNGRGGGRPPKDRTTSDTPSETPSENPPEKPPCETNKNKEGEKNRDRDREAETNSSLEKNSFSASASDGAAVAVATPTSAQDDSRKPVCPLCSQSVRFDAKEMTWRCQMCGPVKEPRYEAVVA